MKKNKKDKKQKKSMKIPKTVQQSIPYYNVYSNGIIETEKGVFTKSYIIKDINYQVANDKDQAIMFVKYEDFLNSFDPNINFQITINNRNIPNEQFEAEALLPLQHDTLDVYRNEYNQMLRDKIKEGKNNIKKDKYITVSIQSESFETACNSFIRIDNDVKSGIKKIGGAEARELTIAERLEILYNIYNIGQEGTFPLNNSNTMEWFKKIAKEGITTKDLIGPSVLKFKADYMEIGDKFAKTLYLKDVPSYLNDSILSEITNADCNMITSMNMQSLPQDEAIRLVRDQLRNIRSNLIDRQKDAFKKGFSAELVSPELIRSQEEANELLSDIQSKNQKLFLTTLIVSVFADSLEELNEAAEKVMTSARKYVCILNPLKYQQELGFNSVLPLCNNKVEIKRTLTTESAAIFIPFTSQELTHKKGAYFGLNSISKNLILLDRNQLKNGNGFIFGTPGCVDKETEFFNGTEWKSIADYVEGEKVLQFNPETNEASLVEPERYIKEKCDLMYHFETKYGINQTLSPEHRVLYYKRDTHNGGYHPEVQEMSAAELAVMQNEGKFRGKFKTDFEYNGPGMELSDIEIKLMLAVVCDGSFNKNNPNSLRCRVNLKKDRKKVELYNLLKKSGKEFRITFKEDGYTEFSFEAPLREKVFSVEWYKCNKEQLQLICDNILQWDGYTNNGRKSFSTTVKENADFVQFAFSACGYRASVYLKDRVDQPYMTNGKEYTRKSIEYTVCISDNTMVGMEWHNDGRNSNVVVEEVAPADGYKYCFTVPTHALVLRRKGNIFITGNSGKSFSAKRSIVNTLLATNDDVIILDPENEYGPLIDLLGGEKISIEVGGQHYINPLDMDENYSGEDNRDPILLKSDFMISLCETVIGGRYGLTSVQRSIIDRCTRLVFKEYQASAKKIENKIVYDQSKLPTLLDFQKILSSQTEREAREIALALELYTSGSLDNFSKHTNVDTNNRFISYNIRDIGSGLQTMAMLVLLDSIWNRILANNRKGKKTWVFIDEAHLLVANDTAATYLKTLYKRSRKYNGLLTCITQNVEDFLLSDITRTMISNAEFTLLLNQAQLDRQELSVLLNISETQLSYITASEPGEGLLIAGQSKNIIPFKDLFPTDTQLYRVMTTKPSEIAQYKKEEEMKKKMKKRSSEESIEFLEDIIIDLDKDN